MLNWAVLYQCCSVLADQGLTLFVIIELNILILCLRYVFHLPLILRQICVCDNVYQDQTSPKEADKLGASYTVCHSFTSIYTPHQVVSLLIQILRQLHFEI